MAANAQDRSAQKSEMEFHKTLEHDPFSWKFPERNETMYLSTIKEKDLGGNSFYRVERPLLSLTTHDIAGASTIPYYRDFIVKDFDQNKFLFSFSFYLFKK